MDTKQQKFHQSKINSGLSKICLIIWKLDRTNADSKNINFDDFHKHLMKVLINIKAILLSNSFEYEQLFQITSIAATKNKVDTESINPTYIAIQDDDFSKLTQAFAGIYLFIVVDSHRFAKDATYFTKLIAFLHSLCEEVLNTVPIDGIAISEQEENNWLNELKEVFFNKKQQFIEILKEIPIKDEYALYSIVRLPIFAHTNIQFILYQ